MRANNVRSDTTKSGKPAFHADALVAVWDRHSKGTKHMIETAKGQELKVYVLRVVRWGIEYVEANALHQTTMVTDEGGRILSTATEDTKFIGTNIEDIPGAIMEEQR